MLSINHTESMTDRQRQLSRKFKNASGEESVRLQIPITNDAREVLGSLTPLTAKEADNADICDSLTRWRRLFRKNFLTQFEPTPQRTRQWLKTVVLPDDSRLMFLIRDETARAVGNFGVCGITAEQAELDNLIRGEKGGDVRLVYFAELALLHWVFATLDVEAACLHVFSTNSKTLALHHSVGFHETDRTPLWRQELDGEIRLVTTFTNDGDAAGFDLVRMEISRQDFSSRYPWCFTNSKGSA